MHSQLPISKKHPGHRIHAMKQRILINFVKCPNQLKLQQKTDQKEGNAPVRGGNRRASVPGSRYVSASTLQVSAEHESWVVK
jgi:hypothetical protein